MTTATKTLTGPRLWLEALRTVPRVNTAEVDPLSRWLILGAVSVVVRSAISAVIGGLLAARDDVFDLPLLILVAVGLVLAHTGSNLVNDFWDYRHGIDSPDSPRVNYGPHPFSGEGNSLREFLLVTAFVLAAAAAIGVYLVTAAGAGVLAFALTGALPLLALVIRFYRRPKPERPPAGYRGWPLWFVGVAFIHNRRFGMLFVAGLACQLAIDAIV